MNVDVWLFSRCTWSLCTCTYRENHTIKALKLDEKSRADEFKRQKIRFPSNLILFVRAPFVLRVNFSYRFRGW